MPYPVLTFPNIPQWENYTNIFWVTNGRQEIDAVVGNNVVNGAIKFIKRCPLNWAKMSIYSGGGNISLADNFLGTALFTTLTPTSLTWSDNFYNEYMLINMTGSDIPLGGSPSQVYYNAFGNAIDVIPANSAVNIFKASNDLWVQGGGVAGSGRAQKQPQTFIVGTTPDAPIVGQNTWTLNAFEGSWVVLVIGRSIVVDMTDAGDGGAYISKSLASNQLTINNYSWNTGDILSYILITP